MPNIPLPQLQAVLKQLDQALYNHEQWYKNLTRVLIARLPADPLDLEQDAHHRCRFGQWYDSADANPLRDHPPFVALSHVHQQMHHLATKLLQREVDGLPIAPADFDQFSNTLDRLRLEIQSLQRELSESLQNRDSLTGARNRVTLLADLREQQALAHRGLHTCSIAMLDLDHFKRVNDEYGHIAGDKVLAETVQCLQALMRPYDRIYRYGGEEFLVCLPSTDLPTAAAMAERLRASIAELPIRIGNAATPLRITVSIGVTLLEAACAVEESIDHADKALYAAKTGGRNRVEKWPADVAAESPESGSAPH